MILTITIPTWLSAAPKNFGTFQHGKLKADEWRTICCIILPIVFGLRWSRRGSTDRQKLLLKNFLYLVTAVTRATRRSISSEDIEVYEKNMTKYVATTRELFGPKLVPNNHLSLHLSTPLRLFGPVHGWWTFPFERYNGILGRIPNNYKIGKFFTLRKIKSDRALR